MEESLGERIRGWVLLDNFVFNCRVVSSNRGAVYLLGQALYTTEFSATFDRPFALEVVTALKLMAKAQGVGVRWGGGDPEGKGGLVAYRNNALPPTPRQMIRTIHHDADGWNSFDVYRSLSLLN